MRHNRRRARVLVFQIYLIGAVVAFAMLAALTQIVAIFPIDVSISRALQAYNPAWFRSLMHVASWPGNAPVGVILVGIIAVFLYRAGWRWEALTSAVAGWGVQALNALLKLIFARPRPDADLVTVLFELSDFGFPSGHVMFYSGYFGFLMFLAFTLASRAWVRFGLLALLASLLFLVGPSRIFLGVHWASDVVAAYLLGSLALVALVVLYRWGKSRSGRSKPADLAM